MTNFGGSVAVSAGVEERATGGARNSTTICGRRFRRETEMLLDSILREDRSVIDLLNADYTFVDETLAKHYGIPDVRGSRFRRVAVPDEARRGLLGQGSFLLVTSVANRTSPVARGKWVLENMLGTPAASAAAQRAAAGTRATAAQQARVGAAEDGGAPPESGLRGLPQDHGPDRLLAGEFRPDRQLAGHAMARVPIDASGQLVDGTKLDGPASLRQALLEPLRRVRPDHDREADDLRHWPGAEVLRHAGGRDDRARSRAERQPVFVA